MTALDPPTASNPHPLPPPRTPLVLTAPPAWFHRPLPARRPLDRLPMGDPDAGLGRALGLWLLRTVHHHPLELRICASGRHAGVWFGLAGIGATPRHAAAVTNAARGRFAAALSLGGWSVFPKPAPGLPRRIQHLAPVERGVRGCLGDLERTRSVLGAASRRGAPLVVRLALRAVRSCPDVVADVLRTDADLRRRLPGRPASLVLRDDPAAPPALVESRALLDEAVSLQLSVSVRGRVLPGPIALRMLTEALSADLGMRLAPSPGLARVPLESRALAAFPTLLGGNPQC